MAAGEWVEVLTLQTQELQLEAMVEPVAGEVFTVFEVYSPPYQAPVPLLSVLAGLWGLTTPVILPVLLMAATEDLRPLMVRHVALPVVRAVNMFKRTR